MLVMRLWVKHYSKSMVKVKRKNIEYNYMDASSQAKMQITNKLYVYYYSMPGCFFLFKEGYFHARTYVYSNK